MDENKWAHGLNSQLASNSTVFENIEPESDKNLIILIPVRPVPVLILTDPVLIRFVGSDLAFYMCTTVYAHGDVPQVRNKPSTCYVGKVRCASLSCSYNLNCL